MLFLFMITKLDILEKLFMFSCILMLEYPRRDKIMLRQGPVGTRKKKPLPLISIFSQVQRISVVTKQYTVHFIHKRYCPFSTLILINICNIILYYKNKIYFLCLKCNIINLEQLLYFFLKIYKFGLLRKNDTSTYKVQRLI